MIEKERIELRFTLLIRDRARYLRKIGSDDLAELSDEEIALGDLLYDPRCVALALATPEERKALDAACWREVPAHLTLVARLERVVGPTFGRGDYDLRRALVMEGVAEALGRHNPELGGLAKLAAMTSYTKLRAWFSKDTAITKVDAEENDLEGSPLPPRRHYREDRAVWESTSDPFLSGVLELALLGCSIEERALLSTVVDRSTVELAADLGVSLTTVKRRRRAVMTKLRSFFLARGITPA
jgi:hypothetical protein